MVMLSELKVVMIDTKRELNMLYGLMDEQYDTILNKDIYRMSELEKDIKEVTKRIANLELKRRELIGNEALSDVVERLGNEELVVLQKEIGVVISLLQIQKDSNMKLLKQLLYFSNKMINVLKPVDTYSTYNSDGALG